MASISAKEANEVLSVLTELCDEREAKSQLYQSSGVIDTINEAILERPVLDALLDSEGGASIHSMTNYFLVDIYKELSYIDLIFASQFNVEWGKNVIPPVKMYAYAVAGDETCQELGILCSHDHYEWSNV